MRKNEVKEETLVGDLSSLESYLQELITFLPIPFCSLTPKGVVLEFNPAFSQISGFESIEAVGGSITKVFPGEEINPFINKTLEKGEVRGREAALFTKEGEKLPVSLFSKARKDEEGRAIGLFVVVFDLSDVKETEKKLQEKIEELEKFKEMAVGREVKMVELKQEIKNLQKKT